MGELVKVQDGKIIIAQEFIKEYAKFEKAKLQMDLKSKEVKKALLEAMEKNDITSYEDDYIKATYRKPGTRVTLDSIRLKKELPDVYQEYSKKSDVASSVALNVK